MILAFGCAATFALGLYAVLTRRDLVALVAGAELMIGAANVQLVALALSRGGDPASASAFGLVVIAAMAAESAVGLALIVTAWRRHGRGRVDEFEEVAG